MVFINVMKIWLPKTFGVNQVMNVMAYRCLSSCALYKIITIKIINREDGLIKSRNVKLFLGSVF